MNLNRRQALAQVAAAGVVGTGAAALADEPAAKKATKGRIKQSLVHWCYKDYWDVEGMCRVAKDLGCPSVITFTGMRENIADDVGLKNCVAGFKKIIGYAEEKKVTLIMEGLNSKVDHKDYMYDLTKWGVELCKRINSERFKLLYDIYHMQIMEGDVIRTIKTCKDYIGHYHTGGNPGRHEIDDTQELNYTAISKAIVETGFKGFMAQEFIPVKDTLASLTQAFKICDV